jgi:hypothetical protein
MAGFFLRFFCFSCKLFPIFLIAGSRTKVGTPLLVIQPLKVMGQQFQLSAPTTSKIVLMHGHLELRLS